MEEDSSSRAGARIPLSFLTTKTNMSNETALVKTNPPDSTSVQEFSAFGNETCFVAAQRMARALCSSTIVPTAFQGEQNLGNCVIALEISNRIGASVLAVMQNIFIIHGKPGWSAQFLISCVNASRKFTPLRYKITGEKGKDNWGCVAWAEDKTGEILESPEVTLEMAKKEGWFSKNGSKWQTMPELMLRYRAATFFARLYAPELTMGIQTADEIAEVIDVDTEVSSPEPVKPTFKAKGKKAEPVPAPVVVAEPVVEPEPTPEPEKPRQTVRHHDTANQTEENAAKRAAEKAQPEPAQPAEPATAGGSAAIEDLKAALIEGGVTTEQALAFALKKNAIKDTADKDMLVLDDILGSKVAVLAKMIRKKESAWEEMRKL